MTDDNLPASVRECGEKAVVNHPLTTCHYSDGRHWDGKMWALDDDAEFCERHGWHDAGSCPVCEREAER